MISGTYGENEEEAVPETAGRRAGKKLPTSDAVEVAWQE